MTASPLLRRALAGVLLVPLLLGAALAGDEVVSGATQALTLLDAVILGIVEGVTEYLPVSSTGHLILVQRMLGIPASPAANAFAICIQAGAIAAVLLLYRQRVRSMTRGLLGRDPAGRHLLLCVGTAFLPAAVVGLALESWIEAHLFGIWPTVAAWFVGGIAILLFATKRPRDVGRPGLPLEMMTPRMAWGVGLAQVLALWPGTSRSLVTIVGGIVVGLGLRAAVEFSFLVGVVTLGAATAWKALSAGPTLVEAYGVVPLAVGFLTATLAAVLAVKWLVAWISAHGLAVFGWYRVGLAVVVSALVLSGVLPGW